jgi:hypothetical protein
MFAPGNTSPSQGFLHLFAKTVESQDTDVAQLLSDQALTRIIREPSRQSFVDPALRFSDLGARQFPVAQVTARFRVFAVLRGWA